MNEYLKLIENLLLDNGLDIEDYSDPLKGITRYESIIDCIEKVLKENEKLRKTMVQAARGSADIVNLAEENIAWETNYNNLTVEHEKVSAIAQAQAREIEQLATALVHTWDNKFYDELVPDHIIQTLDKARAIVRGGE